jgi:hypothetical protein
VPKTVTTIGSCAFYHCEELESITILGPVSSLRDSVAVHTYKLSNIEIQSTVTEIQGLAFGWSGLKNITFNGTKEQWQNISLETAAWNEWNTGCGNITVTCLDGTVLISAPTE